MKCLKMVANKYGWSRVTRDCRTLALVYQIQMKEISAFFSSISDIQNECVDQGQYQVDTKLL